MTESESVALPFGDSPMLRAKSIIVDTPAECKHFFRKIIRFSYAFSFLPLRNMIAPMRRTAWAARETHGDSVKPAIR